MSTWDSAAEASRSMATSSATASADSLGSRPSKRWSPAVEARCGSDSSKASAMCSASWTKSCGMSCNLLFLRRADMRHVTQYGFAKGGLGIDPVGPALRDQAEQHAAEVVGGRQRHVQPGPGDALQDLGRERERRLRQRDTVHRGRTGLLGLLDGL